MSRVFCSPTTFQLKLRVPFSFRSFPPPRAKDCIHSLSHTKRYYTRRHQIACFKATEGPPPSYHGSKLTVQLCYAACLNCLYGHILPWRCCAVNFNLSVFHEFVISVGSCVKLLFGDVLNQPETSTVITTPVKLDRLRKSAIRSQNKRTIYNVSKFFKDISEEPEHMST
jgi:hypothetical protein